MTLTIGLPAYVYMIGRTAALEEPTLSVALFWRME